MIRSRNLKETLAVCAFGICLALTGAGASAQSEQIDQTPQAVDGNFLRRGQETAIDYGKQYCAYVDSQEKAAMAIKQYGIRQRELYENPDVKELELQMEADYGILAVNLGEMDLETARDVEAAFAYMYQEYPVLKGTLTNLTLANFPNLSGDELALTHTREFMINEDAGTPPFVVKTEILLNAVSFLNRNKILESCEFNTGNGHWPEGTNITSLIVHELGHQLSDVAAMLEYGLYDGEEYTGYYITEENHDAFARCMTDATAANQTMNKSIVDEAYQRWLETYEKSGTPEEFRISISEYAFGKQKDGGVSYGETIAEAIADIYLHGETASDASKAIRDVVTSQSFFQQ